ncbi:acyl carrier protein [Enterovibrio norvegicus]|nr:acyl carrier protein [Enterovibrio norvegicus]
MPLSCLTLIKALDNIFESEKRHTNTILFFQLIHGFDGGNMSHSIENAKYLTDSLILEIMSRLESESESAIAAKDIVPSMSLRGDLGMDSMQAVSLTLDLEDSLSISIDDEDLVKLDTVGDLLEIIESKLSQKNG